MPRSSNRNFVFSEAFVDELARSGVQHACISPGSRSTPLVMSLAQQSRIKTWIHLDERSAAYFALGIARASGKTVVVLTTSGTAAANLFPAVVEAHYSHAPVLILTADRPPEQWEWGANQTVDQTRMYGSHAKWSVNMPSPECTPDLLRYVRAMACRAVSTTVQPPAGPVHINFPFREPLTPEHVPSDLPERGLPQSEDAWEGRKQENAYTQIQIGRSSLNKEQAAQIMAELQKLRKGIIICGPQNDLTFPSQLTTLSNQLGFPILADPLSLMRCGTHDRTLIIDSYETFLSSEKLVTALEPEIILRFGATPTSKALLNYIKHHHRACQMVIQETDWPDPLHLTTYMVQANPSQVVMDLTTSVLTTPDKDWIERWLAVAATTRASITKQLAHIDEMFEGKIFAELAGLFPSKGVLFAGNSMPVRYLDSFYPSTSQQIRFLANRGASGIDGVLSTALGASAILEAPTFLVVGDISFYHDMNGLLAAKQYPLKATIIVANNNGGGIFSFLPQRKYPQTFEKYFATPHGLTFESAARLYSLAYSKITSWQEFRTSISKSLSSSRTTILEVPGDRERNVEFHRGISSAAAEAAETTLEQT
ncbi:MAG TPA: 2-succinyl-5-enolpyruvyl-6-hydroxy-3-cyclohexene-1-carboxylic-acid synthase [Candidatus Bathyarchaeia archaeon]|nr:2-succinyl-5-enolpyruvyl-6-hydroxy-3-cyclohexene-1-carboxylic-acid synthase [Candidatus Bathyarchaeia archaeon]